MIPSFFILEDLISCIKEDVSRAKGYVYLLQQFLADKKNNGSVAVAPTGDTHPTPGLALDSCGEVSTCSEHADTPYIEQPWSTLGGYSSPNAASRLLQYGMGRLPGGVINPTVIYDNFLQEGSPQLPDPTVLQYLADSGAVTVVR